MSKRTSKWTREHYDKVVNSIAFYPALICLAFVVLSWMMLLLDYSPTGKLLKASWTWLRLQDADTARNITSTIAAGVLSLTVFSFSMVMIVMNQAASNMSNRLLESMIGNRLQQVVLGFYIGTIVYALLLLSAIRDIDSGVHIPALSVYLLILVTIGDIFLFISFLHYVTQSVLHENIISRISSRTLKTMEKAKATSARYALNPPPAFDAAGSATFDQAVTMPETGYFQGLNLKAVLEVTTQFNLRIRMLQAAGTYLLKGSPMLLISAPGPLPSEAVKQLHQCMDVFSGEPIERNFYYGFRQLTEVAVKALSPGINDPSTAVQSLNALSSLLVWRIHNEIPVAFGDANNTLRVVNHELSIDEMVYEFIFPVWDYGHNDRYVQQTFLKLLPQLLQHCNDGQQTGALQKLLHQVKKAAANR